MDKTGTRMMPIDRVFVIAFEDDNLQLKTEIFRERLASVTFLDGSPVEIIGVQEKISLSMGHWIAWQKAAREKYRSVVILEEGFLPTSHHYHILDMQEPWEMIYLGRTSSGSDIPLEGGFVKPGPSRGSYAYILNASGIQKLLNTQFDHQLCAVDELFAAIPEEHLAVLAPMKNFVSQDKFWSLAVSGYKPKNPQLYEAFIGDNPANLKKYMNLQILQKEFDLICDEPIDNVYSFPLFTALFCKELIEEAEHYGQWKSYRGKNNPSTDIMLDSIGFNEIYSSILKRFVYPLFIHQYQLKGNGWDKLNSQNFIVRYLSEEQGHLGLHNDGSLFSMIVTLNTDFEGGGTIFPKFKKLIKHDQPGFAAIHPGLIGFLHGARPVTKGKRYILASFLFPGAKHLISEGLY
jgi:hypothetical protein